MGERGVDVSGAKAGAKKQDAACLMPPDARRAGAEKAEEGGGALAHALERDGELCEIDGALASGRGVKACRIELEPGAFRGELVMSDACEIGGVDEELALGDADGKDVGDVVVRNCIPIPLPIDEAVDAAEAVGDARGVVRVTRERHELVLLVGKALEAGASLATTRALIDDAVEPLGELAAEVVEIVERAGIEERADHFPKAPLDARLCVGLAADGARTELVVRGERQEPRVVDRLGALPAEDDGLLTVVGAALRGASEAIERGGMSIHQRVEII